MNCAWELRKPDADRRDFDALFLEAEGRGKRLRGGKPEFRREDSELVVLIDGDNEEFLGVAQSMGWTPRQIGGEKENA